MAMETVYRIALTESRNNLIWEIIKNYQIFLQAI